MKNNRHTMINLKEAGIKEISKRESFCLIKDTAQCYISSYGRVINHDGEKYELVIPYFKDGDLWVDIQYQSGETKPKKVKSLVAEEFLIPIDGKTYIQYKDGNLNNCRFDNLYYLDKDELIYIIDKKMKGRVKDNVLKILQKRQQYSSYATFNTEKMKRKLTDAIRRCYDEKWENHESYIGVTVCDEWLNDEQAFFDWAKNDYYEYPEPLELDKDLLSIDGQKQYSPDTCCFLPERINDMFREHPSESGEKGISIGTLKNGSIRYKIGKKPRYYSPQRSSFETLEEAKIEYKKCRIQMLEKVITEELEKGYLPLTIIEGLQKWIYKYENELKEEAE